MARVEVAGGITKTGWSGELRSLKVDAPDIASLALREPARVVYDAGAFSISESCFVNQESSLCVAAESRSGPGAAGQLLVRARAARAGQRAGGGGHAGAVAR